MRQFVEKSGIPFYTTPQGRGVVPDDHPYSYLTMRSTAFQDADLIIILGTRMNYVIGHAAPPRFDADAKIARIEIDAEETGQLGAQCRHPGARRLQIGAGTTDRRARRARPPTDLPAGGRSWPTARRRSAPEPAAITRPTATSTRCGCARRSGISAARRDPVRRWPGNPQFRPPVDPDLRAGPSSQFRALRHDGRRPAVRGRRQGGKPDKQVICLHGDGSFGLNAMELDTAVRHKLPILVVISLNGGWTADPQRNKPGRDLGYTRYDKMAEALGCHGEYVEQPEDIRPALERAQK